MCASQTEADSARLRNDIERMLGLFGRAEWVSQFMLGSSASTDLGMLMSPLGMQAAVVAQSIDNQQTSGTFSQRFLIVPGFCADGLSGGACVTQYSDRRHPLHEKALFKADVRIGRWIRDDATGEWLVLTRNEIDNITRLMWIGSLKSTSRERICITCMSDVFDSGNIERSVLFECSDAEYRLCPLCGSPPGICGGCALPIIRPRHPLDLSTSTESFVAVGGGSWSGNVQVNVFGDKGLVPSTTPFAHYCHHSRDANLARALQRIALSEKVCTLSPSPVPSPLPADCIPAPLERNTSTESSQCNSMSTSAADNCNEIDLCDQNEGQHAPAADSNVLLPSSGRPFTTFPVLFANPFAAAMTDVVSTGKGQVVRLVDSEVIEAERKRKIEMRKVKNRLAAARSNARAREELEKKRLAIAENRTRIGELKQQRDALLLENISLQASLEKSRAT